MKNDNADALVKTAIRRIVHASAGSTAKKNARHSSKATGLRQRSPSYSDSDEEEDKNPFAKRKAYSPSASDSEDEGNKKPRAKERSTKSAEQQKQKSPRLINPYARKNAGRR